MSLKVWHIEFVTEFDDAVHDTLNVRLSPKVPEADPTICRVQ